MSHDYLIELNIVLLQSGIWTNHYCSTIHYLLQNIMK